MDQKLMKTLVGIIGGFVVFIFLLFIISSCSKTKYTYEKLESDMMNVANRYFNAKKDELPAENGDTKTLTLKKMISDGKIDDLSKLFDNDNIKCDGNVTVTNNNGFYIYSPYLSCGKDYTSIYLKDKIIEDQLVTESYGLYEQNDEYVMKGEVKNNYVSFNNELYRIIRINDDGTIRLIKNQGENRIIWDNRYNPDFKFQSGINEYEYNSLNSRIKDTLTELYNNKTAWPDEVKGYIVNQSLCVGKRSIEDTTKKGETECSKKLDEQQFGLITIYEYLQASLDSNCNSTVDQTCRNYNWIANFDSTLWTLTADAETSKNVYIIYKKPSLTNASSSATMNVVFNLTDKAIYVSGTGSMEDPYIFK